MGRGGSQGREPFKETRDASDRHRVVAAVDDEFLAGDEGAGGIGGEEERGAEARLGDRAEPFAADRRGAAVCTPAL